MSITRPLPIEVYNELQRKQIDYWFDSLYFRYAMAIDELRYYKEKYENSNKDYHCWAEERKKRFWEILEEMTQIHVDEGTSKRNC